MRSKVKIDHCGITQCLKQHFTGGCVQYSVQRSAVELEFAVMLLDLSSFAEEQSIDDKSDLFTVVVQTWSSRSANKALVVTQMPLSSTIIDLWRLIKDQSCSTIVMLDEPDSDDCLV